MKIPVNEEGLPKSARLSIDPDMGPECYDVQVTASSPTELAATLKVTEAWVRRVLVPAGEGEQQETG